MNTSQFFKNNLFTKIFKSPQYGQLNKHFIKNPWMNFKTDGRNLSRAGNRQSVKPATKWWKLHYRRPSVSSGRGLESKAKQRKSKAKQSKATQSKAKQSKAKQSKAKQSKAKQSKAKQSKAKQSKAKQKMVSCVLFHSQNKFLLVSAFHLIARIAGCSRF